MRRLDHDLNRFTIELEADTAGITEILEQSKLTIIMSNTVCSYNVILYQFGLYLHNHDAYIYMYVYQELKCMSRRVVRPIL